MKQYHDLLQHVLDTGERKENRTGVDTLSTFNYNYAVDLREGFPLLTTKKIAWKNIVIELLWFLSGSAKSDFLEKHGCKFWRPWYNEDGTVKNCYGPAWRNFSGTDQIAWVLAELKRNPMSRRMVVSAWEPAIAEVAPLPPCHAMFILNVQNSGPKGNYVHYAHSDNSGLWPDQLAPVCNAAKRSAPLANPNLDSGIPKLKHQYWCPECCAVMPGLEKDNPESKQVLNLSLTQRSCDILLGAPYNVASYSLFLELFARFTGLEAGTFAHTLVDAHLYTSKADGTMAEYDHVPVAKEQLTREPRKLPILKLDPSLRDLADVEALLDPKLTTEEVMSHFLLEGYDPWPALTAKVAV